MGGAQGLLDAVNALYSLTLGAAYSGDLHSVIVHQIVHLKCACCWYVNYIPTHITYQHTKPKAKCFKSL